MLGIFYSTKKIIYKEDNRWRKVKILTIKDGDKEFQTVSKGSFGFELEKRCPNNKMLYIKQQD